MSMLRQRRLIPEGKSRRYMVAFLAVGVVLAIQVAGAIVGAVRTSEDTRQVNRDVFSYVAEVTIERVSVYADSAASLVEEIATSVERGGEDLAYADLLEDIYLDMQAREQVRGVYVGYPDGALIALTRDGTGFRGTLLLAADAPEPRILNIHYDSTFTIVAEEVVESSGYDPRIRPWYSGGEASVVPAWQVPTLNYETNDPLVTVSQGVRIDGRMVSVVAAELALAELAPLLDDVPVGDRGQAFVFDERGRFIAAPSHYDDLVAEVIADTGAAPLAADFGIALESGFDGTYWRPTDQFVEADDYSAVQRGFPSANGHHWVLYINASSGSLSGGVAQVNSTVTWLVSLVVVLALFGVAVMWMMWRPLGALRFQAQRDPLTGLHNRFVHDDYGAKIVQTAHAEGVRVCVAVLDLDNFKLINDKGGHTAGDQALVRVAQALLESSREDDLVSRVGGDEFVVVTQLADHKNAMRAVERVRKHAERALLRGLPPMGGFTGIGITAGFAVSEHDFHTLEEIEDNADHALVAGKMVAKGCTHEYREPTVEGIAASSPRER